MSKNKITKEVLTRFEEYLLKEEKSKNTIEKYRRDVRSFIEYCGDERITKEIAVDYKKKLIADEYAPRSINSMIASINALFSFLGWHEIKIKSIKIQKESFLTEERELTRKEYDRLCKAAEKKNNIRLLLILQTICATGIRVSELSFITVEAVKNGKAVVMLKGKTRVVLIPQELKKKLLQYVSQMNIRSGMIFITKNGNSLSRTNIWREMKALCRDANVNSQKVFPHNLRHLFARVFYNLEKDIAKLADVLGHSCIETTRIYIAETGREHRRCLERMHLIM